MNQLQANKTDQEILQLQPNESDSTEVISAPVEKKPIIPDNITQDQLSHDPAFINNSKITYSRVNGKDFDGTDDEAVSWGKSYSADQLYSFSSLGATLSSKPETWAEYEKEAYLYLTKTYGNVDVSLRGGWEFVKSFATDWGGWGLLLGTTILAPETVGIGGLIARESAIGALLNIAHDSLEQKINIQLGEKDNFSYLESLESAGTGAIAGGLLTVAGTAVGKGYRKIFPKKSISEQAYGFKPNKPTTFYSDILAEDFHFESPTSRGLYYQKSNITVIDVYANDLINKLIDLSPDTFKEVLHKKLLGGALTEEKKEIVDRALIKYQEILFEQLQDNIIKNSFRPTEETHFLIEDLISKYKLTSSANISTGKFSGNLLEGRKDSIIKFLKKHASLPYDHNQIIEKYAPQLEIINNPASTAEAIAEARSILDQFNREFELDIINRAENLMSVGRQNQAITLLSDYMVKIANNTRTATTAKAGNWLLEYAISNVFSIATIGVNLAGFISSYTKPLTNTLFKNPFSRRAWEQTFTNYNVMHSTTKGAWQASLDAWRYEHNLLSRDQMKYFPQDTSIKGKLGTILRTIPRELLRTDEFISRIAYNSERASSLTTAILKEKPNATKQELLNAVKQVLDNENLLTVFADDLIFPIITKGIKNNLRGWDLLRYTRKEINKKRVPYLKRGLSKQALQYADDQTYKNMDVINNSQILKVSTRALNRSPFTQLLLGGFFVRSGINTIETGARYTPVVNLFLKSIQTDISGANGELRQAHAQTAIMLSQALVIMGLKEYYKGNVTGGNTYQSGTQKRTQRDSGEPNSYSIKTPVGWWSFDKVPLGMAVKMAVSLAELNDHLALRQSQGEIIDEKSIPTNQILHMINAVAQSVLIDHPFLKAGKDMQEMFERALGNNPDDDALLYYYMSKIAMTTPKSFKQAFGEKDLKTPATYMQATINATDISLDTFFNTLMQPFKTYFDSLETIRTPYSYDILGNQRPRRIKNVFSTFSDFTSKEELQAHLNDTQKEVLEGLYKLVEATGVEFKTPVKSTLLDVDLRGIVINKETGQTAYDRWHEIYKTYAPEDKILKILRSRMPTGTHAQVAKKVTKIQETVNKLYEKSFKTLMKEEPDLLIKYKESIKENKLIKKGRRDSQRFQF